MKKNFFYIILATIFILGLPSCAKVESIFGSYILRSIENVIEDIKYKQIDSIQVNYEVNYENKFIMQSFTLINNNNDSLISEIYTLFCKTKEYTKDIKELKLAQKKELSNTFTKVLINDSTYINFNLFFDNTVKLNYAIFNNKITQHGIIVSYKIKPNLIEFLPFQFKGKGLVKYSTTAYFDSGPIYFETVDVLNELINYYNLNQINNKSIDMIKPFTYTQKNR